MRRGITLIEVLVVLAIVCVLAALAFPAFQNSREQAKVAVTTERLKNIGVALLLYREQCEAKDSGTPSEMGSPLGGFRSNDLWTVLRLPIDTFKCASPKKSVLNPIDSSGAYKCMSCPGMVGADRRSAFERSWSKSSEVHGSRMPFVVMMCHADPNTSRSSVFSTHLGLGVNFEGQFVKIRKTGTWQKPEWWATY